MPDPGPAREGEIILTGATGFIGRQVVQRLLKEGQPVTAITRRLHSLPPEILEPALDGRLRLFEATLDDEPGLQAALEGAQVCLHLATGGGDNWETVQEAMVQRSRRLAELCAEAKVQRFIYVSSVAALYPGPMREFPKSTTPTPPTRAPSRGQSTHAARSPPSRPCASSVAAQPWKWSSPDRVW